MSKLFVSRVGGVVSADIAVTDHEKEKAFYGSVLTTGDSPLWRDDLMNSRGTPIIGLGERVGDYKDLPLQWMPHFMVKDVAESVQRALDNGGTALLHGKNDAGESLWAGLQDPNGAAFGLIPVVPQEAMPTDSGDDRQTVGHIGWVDLTVDNAEATRDFYQQVIGWTVEEVPMGTDPDRYADFNMVASDGEPGAGICHGKGSNSGLPPVWLHYLPVGDIDESLSLVSELGGKVVSEVMGSDGAVSFAIVEDPIGVAFALMRA